MIVGIVAGKKSQSVALHCGEKKGIAAEESMLAAKIAGEEYVLGVDGQDVNADADDFIQGLSRFEELLDISGVAPKALADPGVNVNWNQNRR